MRRRVASHVGLERLVASSTGASWLRPTTSRSSLVGKICDDCTASHTLDACVVRRRLPKPRRFRSRRFGSFLFLSLSSNGGCGPHYPPQRVRRTLWYLGKLAAVPPSTLKYIALRRGRGSCRLRYRQCSRCARASKHHQHVWGRRPAAGALLLRGHFFMSRQCNHGPVASSICPAETGGERSAPRSQCCRLLGLLLVRRPVPPCQVDRQATAHASAKAIPYEPRRWQCRRRGGTSGCGLQRRVR